MEIDGTKNIIIFYDGECGFCHSSVQFVLKHRKHNSIYFSTLQTDLAKRVLNKKGIEIKLDTLYFLKNNEVYHKSTAGLRITSELKFPYPLFKVFLIVPKFIRDAIYSFVAKRRHKIGNSFCVLPTEEESKLFIS